MLTRVARCEVAIEAPIEIVWTAMLDFGRYEEWNPFVIHVACAARDVAVGDRIGLHVRWHDGGEARSSEQVTELRSPRLIDGLSRARLSYGYRGALHALGLVRGNRVQELEQRPGSPTSYRSEEHFRGALVRFLPLAKVQDGFERHAAGLKARAEALHRGA